MDFQDTSEEAAFRTEVRRWLDSAAADYRHPPAKPFEEHDLVARGRAWQKVKAEGGYAGIVWPKAIGGRGGTTMEATIYDQEEDRFHIPKGAFVAIGTGMAIPTITRHGTPEQAERFTRPTLLGDIIWCQLFSEPSAGSDLAALRTKAERTEGGYLINGQKVWSSWAHHADFGILLARTDPSLPKHKGLTFFVLDMKTPGITIRPIRQISKKSDFNEVFLENVFIPDANRIGAEGEGWACAMTTLTSERLGSGANENDLEVSEILNDPEMAGQLSDADREKLAWWWTREQGIRNLRFRLLTDLSKGQRLGAEAAMVKLAYAHKLQDLAAFTQEIDGYAGLFPQDDHPLRRKAADAYFWGAVMRIAGGADEVLRNQLAERVLGMPGEMRLDKTAPFESLNGG